MQNELQFIHSCHLYDNLRLQFFKEIHEKYKHLDVLDGTSKILFYFNNVNPYICSLTAACTDTFVHELQTEYVHLLNLIAVI